MFRYNLGAIMKLISNIVKIALVAGLLWTLVFVSACESSNDEESTATSLLLMQAAGDSPLIPNQVILDGVAASTTGLRGDRYCEVLLVEGGPLEVRAAVYNTIGHSLCPAAEWEALSPDQIKEDYGALAVEMNGPRVWTIDGVQQPGGSSSQEAVFGTLTMGLVAIIKLSLGKVLSGSSTAYIPQGVIRSNIWIYDAGSKVYELVDPRGQVYRMQSLAQFVDESLTIASLDTLGSSLDMPQGWTYQVRTLTQDEGVAATDGIAIVIADELRNTYQLTDNIVDP